MRTRFQLDYFFKHFSLMLMAFFDFVHYVDGDVAMLMAICFLTMKMAICDFVHYVAREVMGQ